MPSVTWTLISVMALSGVVKVDCDRRSKGREKGRNYSRGRRGEEGSHAGLPTPFYNYVEWKLRNTNFEYLRWQNTVFFRTQSNRTGNWAAKISKVQNRLKKIIF